MRSYVKYKIFLYCLLAAGILGLFGYSYYVFSAKVPEKITLKQNEESMLDLSLPFTGEIEGGEEVLKSVTGDEISSINFNYPVEIKTGAPASYDVKLKLFGLIYYKDITIDVVENQYLYACGMPVGVYLKAEGVLVIDNAEFSADTGETICPSKNIIQKGDYIQSVNGSAIKTKTEFIDIVKNSDGADLIVGILRNNNLIDVKVTPQKDTAGEYKVGVWIRDDTQGIGTLTYVDELGNFGALGHGISDIDTGEIFDIHDGILYRASILTIVKGQAGTPGEYVGTIDYSSKNQFGYITENGNRGIFGSLTNNEILQNFEKYEVGYKYDVKPGKAYIISGVDENVKEYEVEINWLDPSDSNVNKGIEFTVTDPELINLTNGIVQGMSGSPIIQDGKIIGAVTHVFVNDSKKGYGIFIENMLEHN